MFKIKIGDKWISKENVLMFTDNESEAAELTENNAYLILDILSCGYEIELIEV